MPKRVPIESWVQKMGIELRAQTHLEALREGIVNGETKQHAKERRFAK